MESHKYMKRFVCSKISAEISTRQCAINYERAASFEEGDYFASPLRKAEKKHYSTWGIAGIKNFFHPNTQKCKGCAIGAKNLIENPVQKKDYQAKYKKFHKKRETNNAT